MHALLVFLAVCGSDSTKIPLPPQEEQQANDELVRDLYSEHIKAAKSQAEKSALAKRLLKDADATRDQTGRYAMITIGRGFAVQGGDADTAMSLIDLAAEFDVDAETMRLETLEALAGTCQAEAQAKSLGAAADEFTKIALEDGHIQVAERAIIIASLAAKRSKDVVLVKTVLATSRAVVKATQSVSVEN